MYYNLEKVFFSGGKIMLALGIITLFLTGFMLIFYAYLSRHTDHDVSFFMSVGIISMFMNLCTNIGGPYGLSVVYLIIAVAFLALGFAVSVQDTLGFYKSIGPWFRTTFTDKQQIGWKILSMAVFPAGIALYFTWYEQKNELAKTCGKCALWGLLLLGLLLWAILGPVL